MIRELKCMLGFHKIIPYADAIKGRTVWDVGKKCQHCGKIISEPKYHPPFPLTPKSKLVAPRPWPIPKAEIEQTKQDTLNWIENGK